MIEKANTNSEIPWLLMNSSEMKDLKTTPPKKTKAPFKTSNRAGQTSQSHGSDRASNKVDRGEAWLIRDGAGYNMIP